MSWGSRENSGQREGALFSSPLLVRSDCYRTWLDVDGRLEDAAPGGGCSTPDISSPGRNYIGIIRLRTITHLRRA